MAPEGEVIVFLAWVDVLYCNSTIYRCVGVVRGIRGGSDGADLRKGGTRLVGVGEGDDAPPNEIFGCIGVHVYIVVAGSNDDAVVGGCDGKGFVGSVGGGELEGVGEGENLVGARVDEMNGAIPRGSEEDGR